jgi:predicted adenylyl cyclase CyaB
MLGASACVRKRREVWLYRNARIHLDTVDGLGRFIEIEVIVAEGMAQAHSLMKALRGTLGIDPANVIARSYGDLSGGKRGQDTSGKNA